MKEENVAIWIKSTNQTATAKWHLEGIGLSDSWVAIIDEISDLKPFPMFSKVRVTFRDRVVEAEFYYGNEKLIQRDSSKLDFWIGKENKESEEKSMLHNLTVKHEENKVLEKYWLMRAMKKGSQSDFMISQTNLHIGKGDLVIKEQELDHEPIPQEIAQFLSDTKADFVSVMQNYRFENELPFC